MTIFEAFVLLLYALGMSAGIVVFLVVALLILLAIQETISNWGNQ